MITAGGGGGPPHARGTPAPPAGGGGEVYFETPVEAQPEPGARDEMAAGELAFWPAGRALCIFFGPTPVSRGEEPRAASPVTPLGRVTSGAERLTRVEAGAPVRVIRALAG